MHTRISSFLFLLVSACSTTVVVTPSDGGAGSTGSNEAPTLCSGSCSGQSCVDGYCLKETTVTCRLADDGNDGCDANSICRDEGDGPHCYPVPACPASGVCPAYTSSYSAACNTNGALPGKNQICIPGRCLADADCSQNQGHCLRKKTGDVLGTCSGYLSPGTLEQDGNGGAYESYDGCEMTPSLLVGKGAPGSPCTAPTNCAPTCCSCGGGQSAVLAAKCTYTAGTVPVTGTCASAADACAIIESGGAKGTCTAP